MLKISFQNLKAEENKIDEVVCEVRTCLFNLYNEYRGADGLVSQPMNEGEDENVGNDLEGYDDVQTKMFHQLVQQRKEEQLVEISNEVDKYLTDPFESPFTKGFKLLNW
ncbi:hypothetical protein L3X38_018198 [Prunus dulcis]|uniref:Uncharacterized protein n=1 Tax=Prunus dulcis TaxID=3755 RepID=A0AAD4WB45_PRUDU|nr:hypothetical protein L3X38_018198 [Prunus dulcis]